jgi:excisionase family DNA binding protein
MNGEPTSLIDLLKPAVVAKRLGVSRTWLYDAAKDGRIPAIRIGGEEGPLRFVPEDIEQWIEDARAAWKPGCSAQPTRSPAQAAQRLGVRTRRPV